MPVREAATGRTVILRSIPCVPRSVTVCRVSLSMGNMKENHPENRFTSASLCQNVHGE